MTGIYPILEYDSNLNAVINPATAINALPDMPEAVVLCFFADVIADLLIAHQDSVRVLHSLRSEIGSHPIYELTIDSRRIAFAHPGVGAPLAAGIVEEIIALGGRKFIACGGAGVLNREIAVGHLIVPVTAIRDEGTSYHYMPPGREAHATASAVAAIESVLRADGVPYLIGKTWTTDGLYRETPGKVARRRDEGCLVVEMEAAAFFAVAQFRGITFGQILYGGDDVSSNTWDSRHWTRQTSVREKLFWLAAEAALKL